MKRIAVILGIALLTLTGCGDGGSTDTAQQSATAQVQDNSERMVKSFGEFEPKYAAVISEFESLLSAAATGPVDQAKVSTTKEKVWGLTTENAVTEPVVKEHAAGAITDLTESVQYLLLFAEDGQQVNLDQATQKLKASKGHMDAARDYVGKHAGDGFK